MYGLATLSEENKPKVRMVIHRAVTPSSSLLLTTTDTRMKKPAHLAHDPHVELAWWMDPVAIQFRINGSAYTIPPQSDAEGKSKAAEALKALGTQGDEANPEWWEKERMRLWKEAMSGHLRASFGRPTPGTPLDQCPPSSEWPERLDAESDDPEEKKKIEYALSHFALLAIRVDGFEKLELKPTPNIRTQWTRQEGGDWKKQGVAP